MIEDINHLDSSFNTKRVETEKKLMEAKRNYYSALDNFEVSLS